MDLEDTVCLCFHVSRRKLVSYVRLNKPRVASQLSECGSAGTGCGWCIPFLKQIHERGTEATPPPTAAEYAALRAAYIRGGRGTPPDGSLLGGD